jgi:hypothetical protein
MQYFVPFSPYWKVQNCGGIGRKGVIPTVFVLK